MSTVTILTAKGSHLLTKSHKRLPSGDVETTGYGKAVTFTARVAPFRTITDLAGILDSLSTEPYRCIVRADLRDGANPFSLNRKLKRTANDAREPDLVANPEGKRWVKLDLDSLAMPHSDGLEYQDGEIVGISDPVTVVRAVIATYLPAYFQRVSVYYSFSASAGVKPWNEVRLGLYYVLDRPIPDKVLARWAKRLQVVDPAVFTPNQCNYTAAPIFHGMRDPCAGWRSGLIELEHGELSIPERDLAEPAKQRPPAREQRDPEREPNPKRERAYVLAALDSEAADLKSKTEGNRHLALRDAAYALGGYVRPGLLEAHEVEDALYEAATANGLVDDDGEAKVRDVLKRALAAGAEAPRELPPEPAKGTITFTTNSEPEDLPDAEDWPEIEPLPEQLPAVPPLPPEMLPDSLRPWLKDVAERQNTPLEMPAAAAVVALGATIGRGLGIYPKKHDDDWLVIPNLFGGVCGPPGIMKSAAISEATKPLRRIEAEAWEQFDQDQAANEALKERLRLELEELKRQMKDALKKGDTNRVDAIQADLSDKTAELNSAETTARRYATQDATVEKLGELLQENQRGLLVLRDELAGWLRTLERPGREGDREFYLEAWNGTGGYTFDRIGRGTVRIPAVCLSILGGIQPGKLRRYIHEALDGGSGADGLLQRLQVVVWPEHLGEWRNVDRYPDRAAAERAYLIFKRLSELDGAALGLFEGEEPVNDPAGLHFSAEAQDLFDTWRGQLEARLRDASMSTTPAFESHMSKYRSLMPSLALIFHLVELVDGQTESTEVSLKAAQLACAWCDYLELHARRIYAAETNTGVIAAHALMEKIDDGAINDGMTVRDIYRAGWEGLSDRSIVQAALTVLEQHHAVRVVEHQTGGRSSAIVRLHPSLRGAVG